jgi:hypothetical protein
MKMGAAVCCAAAQAELLAELPPLPPLVPLVPLGLPLMVVLPAVLTIVDEPDVMVVRTGAVVTADDVPFPPDELFPPDEPTVVEKVDPPLVTTDTTGAVVTGVAPDSDE